MSPQPGSAVLVVFNAQLPALPRGLTPEAPWLLPVFVPRCLKFLPQYIIPSKA